MIFGQLEAIEMIKSGPQDLWLCFCSCGGELLVAPGLLSTGVLTNCGNCNGFFAAGGVSK